MLRTFTAKSQTFHKVTAACVRSHPASTGVTMYCSCIPRRRTRWGRLMGTICRVLPAAEYSGEGQRFRNQILLPALLGNDSPEALALMDGSRISPPTFTRDESTMQTCCIGGNHHQNQRHKPDAPTL
ncbi:hypothetical protein BAUCODRAFT_306220 [Baudoinia panamericana UAMH 10762]|uniref:Uncharacterized protein n=1 Tax=Baudoinia panamericana (strain UAMH 10762) TaxID=717646 RepID=M2MZR6_BAUPA|nr:uncharacterized protein BAUCODRAFT_306220 [Baudoinia panamericana UAMH 10762]EMC91830.1 hypothetical protein BAUCODRAFT_306220 [Baudoinia panamericana UAMH 10762]